MFKIAYIVPFWGTAILVLYMLYSAIAGAADMNLKAPWHYRPKLILIEAIVLVAIGFLCPHLELAPVGPIHFGTGAFSFRVLGIAYAMIGIPLACISWAISRAFAKKSDIDDMNKYA